MPPLAKKKPTAPKAPKKPTSKSKTGNAECSSAASNWQLALRGKAALEPGTHKTLAKCRALVQSKKGAGLREASGKYSEQGRAALESRLQKRFDSDLVTAKSRREKLGGLREEDQLKLYRKATEGNWTAGKTGEFATELKRAPLVKVGSGGLFGDDDFVNTAEQRAALSDRLKTNLKSGKKLFGTVSRSRNVGRLESAGNKIDKESSAAQAETQDKALMAFDIERKFNSRTSMVLDRYAGRLAKGEKLDKVYGEFENRVLRALDRDMKAKPISGILAKRKARLVKS